MSFPVPTASGKAREEPLPFSACPGKVPFPLRAAEGGRKKAASPQPTRATTPGCRHDGGKGRGQWEVTACAVLGEENSCSGRNAGERPPPHAPQRTQMNELNKTGVVGLLYAVLAIQEAKIERPSNPGMASLPYAPRLASFPPKPHII